MSALSRRDFLVWSATAGLAGVLGCGSGGRKKPKPVVNARVVVLGGGYAGATAARYLRMIDPAVRVTLIEQSKKYLCCPGSNEFIASLKQGKNMGRDYKALIAAHGIEKITAEATGIDAVRHVVKLTDGAEVSYDRLILAPGIAFQWDAIEGYDETASEIVPHAWKAGRQTGLLRRQLRAMPNGGVVLITVPANPYRCPPGPYERASLIACFFKRYKPRSKVLILDAKTQFSKQSLFQQGWRELYPGMVEWVSSEKEGRIDHIDIDAKTVHTEFGRHRADVLNVIPPQEAGSLARMAGLVDSSGWCPVDLQTFESTLAPGIHVIGDACIANPMPKSAFAANSQAKVCAAAVINLLRDVPPSPPSLINHCYSFLSPDYAISVTGVYEYSPEEKGLKAVSIGETPPKGDRLREAEHARSWYKLFSQDVFG